MVWIVHADVVGRLAAPGTVLEVLAVATFEHVDLGVVDLGVVVVVEGAILGAQVFRTVQPR